MRIITSERRREREREREGGERETKRKRERGDVCVSMFTIPRQISTDKTIIKGQGLTLITGTKPYSPPEGNSRPHVMTHFTIN